MSSLYAWTEIPAPIRSSIEANTPTPTSSGCSCHKRGERWYLCQYHVGMMDGWDMAEESPV
jgi:hypothetical protein